MTEKVTGMVQATMGWRKLSAWFACFALVSYVTIDAMVSGTTPAQDMPPTAAEVLKWVTSFFFGTSVLEHFAGAKK